MVKRPIFFVIISSICFFSCKKQKDTEPIAGNNVQPIQLNSFPLTVGNSWKYYSELYFTDSIGNIGMYSYYNSFWESLSDTVINGIVSTKISQLDSNFNGTTHLAHTYYANEADGLYGIAVENLGGLFFLRESEQVKLSTLNLFSSFGIYNTVMDTPFVPSPSLRLMKFPSTINDIWISYEYNNPTSDIFKRKWVAYSTITTNAGTFDCIKMQLFFDYNFDNQPDSGTANIIQYFSSKGLIQEEYNDIVTFADGSTYTFNRISKLIQ